MASVAPSTHPSVAVFGEPVWDLALLHPAQGKWSHEDYLRLTDDTNWLIEYTAGHIEVLPMPTIEHQLILKFLFRALDEFVERQKLGVVLFAPTRVYIDPDNYREPDVVFSTKERLTKSGNRYFQGADLVMEVVSDDPESHERDFEKKVSDYAEGGISEYWIVDPQEKKITVLTLVDKAYQQHGVFGEGEVATSKLLAGFSVVVTDVFAAAKV
jgi:Uma2 family endonuclease